MPAGHLAEHLTRGGYQRLDVSNHLDQRPIHGYNPSIPVLSGMASNAPAGIMAIVVLVG